MVGGAVSIESANRMVQSRKSPSKADDGERDECWIIKGLVLYSFF
jgi:hypothetical protein